MSITATPNTEEIKLHLLERSKGNGILFKFILFNSIIWLIFLITILKPHRLYKQFVINIFNLKFSFNNAKWSVYHLLGITCIFHVILFAFLSMQKSTYNDTSFDNHLIRMSKLDKKWVLESEIWLTFLCIVSILTIYRNAILFKKESEFNERIEAENKLLTK